MDVVLPKPGRYVVAVSGGVDSMALLDMLSRQPGLDLVVAHFDHGIRPDSSLDSELVEFAAMMAGLAFICKEGKLGPRTSEAAAREARYKFLRQVMKDKKAAAIITAHHQDDLIETAILNMLRGTGRKGLTSLKSGNDTLRPLLKVTKEELINYARENNLQWREDSTNEDESYLRNYVRRRLVAKLTVEERQKLLNIIGSQKQLDTEIDSLLAGRFKGQSINRQWFNALPHEVAREVLAAWLRSKGIRQFDRKTLERLVVSAKTGRPGKSHPVLDGCNLMVEKNELALAGPER